MRSWAAGKALAKHHQIRVWKKRHLHRKGEGTPVLTAQHPAFRATSDDSQRSQELDEFLNRLRDRR